MLFLSFLVTDILKVAPDSFGMSSSMLVISAQILLFSSTMVFGRLMYTKELRYPLNIAEISGNHEEFASLCNQKL